MISIAIICVLLMSNANAANTATACLPAAGGTIMATALTSTTCADITNHADCVATATSSSSDAATATCCRILLNGPVNLGTSSTAAFELATTIDNSGTNSKLGLCYDPSLSTQTLRVKAVSGANLSKESTAANVALGSAITPDVEFELGTLCSAGPSTTAAVHAITYTNGCCTDGASEC